MTPRQIHKSELVLFWDKKATKILANLIGEKARFLKLSKQLNYLGALANFKLSSSQLESLRKPVGLVRGYISTFSALMRYVESQNVILSFASLSSIKENLTQARHSVQRVQNKISLQRDNPELENDSDTIITPESFKRQVAVVLKNHEKLKSLLIRDLNTLQTKDLIVMPVKLIENQFTDLEADYFSKLESKFLKQEKILDFERLISYFKSWADVKSGNLNKLSLALKLIEELKNIYLFLRMSEGWKISASSHAEFIKYLKSIDCHSKDISDENKKINQLVNIVKIQKNLHTLENHHLERIKKQLNEEDSSPNKRMTTSSALASLGFVPSKDRNKTHQRGRSSSFDDSSLARVTKSIAKSSVKETSTMPNTNSLAVKKKVHQRMRSRSFHDVDGRGQSTATSTAPWIFSQPNRRLTSPRSPLLQSPRRSSDLAETEKNLKKGSI